MPKKYIVLVQIDLMGIFSWYRFTIRTKVVMIQQKYVAITGVNYRAGTKRFTHRRCKKFTCQFLDDAKITYQKAWCKFSFVQLITSSNFFALYFSSTGLCDNYRMRPLTVPWTLFLASSSLHSRGVS